MNSVTYDSEKSNAISNRIMKFIKRFHVGEILRSSNAYKEQGIPVLSVLLYLF